MKDECQIVQDLLPLVKDDVASEASIVFVQSCWRRKTLPSIPKQLKRN